MYFDVFLCNKKLNSFSLVCLLLEKRKVTTKILTGMLMYVDRIQWTLEHSRIGKQMMIVFNLPLQVMLEILLNLRVFDLRGQGQRLVDLLRVLPIVDVHHETAETEAKRDAHQKGEYEVTALGSMWCFMLQFGVENFL